MTTNNPVSIERTLVSQIDAMIKANPERIKCETCDGCGMIVNPEFENIWNDPAHKTDQDRMQALKYAKDYEGKSIREEIICHRCKGVGDRQLTRVEELQGLRDFVLKLIEKIDDLDTRSEESDSFDTGHHLAIREVLQLIGEEK